MEKIERFSNFNLHILSSNFNLRACFVKLFNFKLSKTCWKNPKLNARILAHFKKRSKSTRQTHFSKWAKILLYNFGLFQQVFDNLKLNNLTKQARRLKLEDRIWRLKLEKRSFWPILRGKTPFFFKKRWKSTRQNHFFKMSQNSFI